MKKSIITASLALLCVANVAFAQDDEPKFKITPTGRILLDGGVFVSPENDLRHDGLGIPDARLGVNMSYGKWGAKVDVGFAQNKVGIKDIYFKYTIDDKSFVQLGHFIHQYGLQSATSSSMKVTMEEPISNAALNDDRMLGAMYQYYDDLLLATGSIHADAGAGTSKMFLNTGYVKEGFGLRTRIAVHPICEPGKVLQVGISGAFSLPRTDEINGAKIRQFNYGSNFPNRLMADDVAIYSTIYGARNSFKFTPDLLLCYGPVAIETQYYYNHVNRTKAYKTLPSQGYTAYGAYAIVRGLILGGNYGYSKKDGGLATPKKGALELAAMYNYTNLTDAKAAVWGGRTQGFSVTMNYYINRYMIARLHYGYTHAWDNQFGPRDLSAIMARLQVIF